MRAKVKMRVRMRMHGHEREYERRSTAVTSASMSSKASQVGNDHDFACDSTYAEIGLEYNCCLPLQQKTSLAGCWTDGLGG